MSDIIAFNSDEDFDRVMRAVRFFETQYRGMIQSNSAPDQTGIYAKVTELITDTDDKEAKAVQVQFDDATKDFIAIDESPYIFDNTELDSAGATAFTTTNIVSKNAMAVDQVYLLQYYPYASETSDWLVVETGGGGARAYIEITEEVETAIYLGNILVGPEDSNILEEGVNIRAVGLVDNGLAVGDRAFVDKVGDIYYIQSVLLL